jgi:hypothetical protein
MLLRLACFHGDRIFFGKLGQLLPFCFGEKGCLTTKESVSLDVDALTTTFGWQANPNSSRFVCRFYGFVEHGFSLSIRCIRIGRSVKLVEIYRDMNGGDCMVNVFLAGKQSERPACSHRTGCWTCARVSQDSSAESMIAMEGGGYDWLNPLSDCPYF